VEDDEHKMVMMYSHLGGRSQGDNTTDSPGGSLHTIRFFGCIRMDLRKNFVGKHS
jgi:hypothetical protein